jgi:raffinose/stachyose/melibiose transport system permease protein
MKSGRSAISFLAPALAVYALLVLFPIGEAAVFSTWRWSGIGDWSFVGLANYLKILRDPIFYRSILHNLELAAASVLFQLPISLALAIAFQGRSRICRWLRALVFSPMILPSAIIAVMFMMIYEPLTGPLAVLLTKCTGSSDFGFLANKYAVMPLLIVAISWRYIGFHMMLMLAALQGIDRNLYEAAAVDGAGSGAQFRHITLPSIAPTLILSALLAILGSLKYFDLVYIMTGGGVNHASELVTTYLYQQGIEASRFGYANALAIVLLALSLCCGLALQLARRRLTGREG